MTPRDLLEAAADYMDKWGWQKKAYGGRFDNPGNTDGPCCIYGALYSAAMVADLPNRSQVREDASECVLEEAKSRGTVPTGYNDTVAKTKEDAVNFLRAAALRCTGG